MISRRCFPESEKDIRLYSCLANTHSNQFLEGERLFEADAVGEIFQIGYHISATVKNHLQSQGVTNFCDVSVRVDKCRIVSCNCTCSSSSSWCQHIVAVCLKRIHDASSVQYRETVWYSITGLGDSQVKKLAQYLINELPREYLPVAQKLIDELKNPTSDINRSLGAPDPTADGHNDESLWCMNEKVLHENIFKILTNFVRPAPTVHCDVQYLSSSSPPASNEWNMLIRPLRSREPEALWNLLSIVREMLKRGDENASTLLHIITVDCLRLEQLPAWWYQTALSRSGHWQLASGLKGGGQQNIQSQVCATQHNAASLCDEIVELWRLIALNPKLTSTEHDQLSTLLQLYHGEVVSRIWKRIESGKLEGQYSMNIVDANGARLNATNAFFTERRFPGFFPALQACYTNWSNSKIGRVVRELQFSRIQKLLESNSDVWECGNVEESTNEFRNIPLLQHGPDALASEVAIVEQPSMSNAMLGAHAQTKSSRSRHKRRKAQRRHQQRQQHQQQRLLRRQPPQPQQHQQQQQRRSQARQQIRLPSQESVENNSPVVVSEDSLAEDEELDNPSCSQPITIKREPFVDELETLYASAHCELDGFAIRFTCCEALATYGYTTEAFILARCLAEELLESPPNLLMDVVPNDKTLTSDDLSENNDKLKLSELIKDICCHNKRTLKCNICSSSAANCDSIGDCFSSRSLKSVRRFVPPSDARLDISQLAVTTLSRTIFLVRSLTTAKYEHNNTSVVEEHFDDETRSRLANSHSLALELGIRILRNPRGPAATKSLEVQINHLEHELVALLRKNVVMTSRDLAFVRGFALDYLRELKKAPVNRIIVPPLSMAQYVLDVLGGVLNGKLLTQASPIAKSISDNDDALALAVALETLGMRVFVLEADHPMLCECIRRQRGDLSLTLLVRNRDSGERLAIILEKVLDSAVHQMYNSETSNSKFFWNQLDARHSVRNPSYNLADEILFNTNKTGPQLIAGSNHYSQPSTALNHLNERKSARAAESVPNDNRLLNETHNNNNNNNGEASNDAAADVGGNRSTSVDNDSGKRTSCSSSTSSSSNSAIVNAMQQKYSQILSNFPTEAQAHFMVELAKRLLTEAGGNQSTAMFISLSNAHIGGSPAVAVNNNNSGVGASGSHRNLHICSFLTGLYALGLNNLVTSTWPTRTYSTHVSWIQAQAMEIGRPALQIVRETWESHLTPTEVASLADKASQSADPGVVEEGAYLALSVLPKAFALTAIESQKALNQCKEHSPKLLERACLAVERSAEKDGVYPEVLFKVANHWYNLHLSSLPATGSAVTTHFGQSNVGINSSGFNTDTYASSHAHTTAPSQSMVSAPIPSSSMMMHPPYQYQQQYSCPPPNNFVNVALRPHTPTGTTTQPQVIDNAQTQPQQFSSAELLAAKTQAMIDQIVQQHHPRHNGQASHHHQQQQQQITSGYQHTMNNGGYKQDQQQFSMLQSNNGNPFSVGTGMLPSNSIMLAHSSIQPMTSSESGLGRLHVSHSAPNLQPISRGTIAPNAQFPTQVLPPSVPMGPIPPTVHPNNMLWNTDGILPVQQKLPVANSAANAIGLAVENRYASISQRNHPIIHMLNNGNIPFPQPNNLNILPPLHVIMNNTYLNQMPMTNSGLMAIPPPPPPIIQQQQQQSLPTNVGPILSGPSPRAPNLTVSAYVNHPQSQSIVVQHQQMKLPKPPLPRFLINAHRVGMRAMDTMGLRNSDDNRSYSKYSPTPNFCDDIRWLFEEVSIKLGDGYVHSFCEKACTCIASPFLVFQLIKESIKYFKLPMPQISACIYNVYLPSSSVATTVAIAGTGVAAANDSMPTTTMQHAQMNAVKSCAAHAKYLLIVQQVLPPSVADLMRHCIEMCYMAAFNKLNHSRFTEVDIEDTCELLLMSRQVFGMIPQPHCRTMFEAFLRFIRKQKACKKEPIQRFNNALHPPNSINEN